MLLYFYSYSTPMWCPMGFLFKNIFITLWIP